MGFKCRQSEPRAFALKHAGIFLNDLFPIAQENIGGSEAARLSSVCTFYTPSTKGFESPLTI